MQTPDKYSVDDVPSPRLAEVDNYRAYGNAARLYAKGGGDKHTIEIGPGYMYICTRCRVHGHNMQLTSCLYRANVRRAFECGNIDRFMYCNKVRLNAPHHLQRVCVVGCGQSSIELPFTRFPALDASLRVLHATFRVARRQPHTVVAKREIFPLVRG